MYLQSFFMNGRTLLIPKEFALSWGKEGRKYEITRVIRKRKSSQYSRAGGVGERLFTCVVNWKGEYFLSVCYEEITEVVCGGGGWLVRAGA